MDMSSFQDLERHLGRTPASTVQLLTAADRAAGRQQSFARHHPEQLDALRQVALIQSAEASNAIEHIHAPIARIKKLVEQTTEPKNRSEQEIAGYRYALDVIHANTKSIDFEPRFVEQIHGYLARYTGDTTAGRWKQLDNEVEEVHPNGSKTVRFVPVSADDTPAAMADLHKRLASARAAGDYHHLLLTAAYVLDFLVIHPFRDGNGRMSRLLTLLLLYHGDYEAGRYISLEKLVEDSKETYYEALAGSTTGWHEGQHDLEPWTQYFLGIVNAAYSEFEKRTTVFQGKGSKTALVERFIATSLSRDFKFDDIRHAAPGVSDSTIRGVLQRLKREGVVEPLSTGRSAKWRRLRSDFLDTPETS
jgi:Fic family protein